VFALIILLNVLCACVPAWRIILRNWWNFQPFSLLVINTSCFYVV